MILKQFCALTITCCTLLAEWVRAGPVGLPWVLTGHAVAWVPLLLQTAEWGGAWAVGLLAYNLGPMFAFVVSPQGDIAFSKEEELGTTNAWVWPVTVGLRVKF